MFLVSLFCIEIIRGVKNMQRLKLKLDSTFFYLFIHKDDYELYNL